MNESMESGTKELGVVASQREEEVVKDTAGEEATQVSPFGSAAAVNEEEVVRELPPILDLPESETASVKTASEPETETASIETVSEPEPETASFETVPAPEPETASIETAPEPEAPALEVASAPAEEYEVPRMSEPVVEESIPEVSPPTMSAEPAVQNDEMFGSFKRLLVDLIGED